MIEYVWYFEDEDKIEIINYEDHVIALFIISTDEFKSFVGNRVCSAPIYLGEL